MPRSCPSCGQSVPEVGDTVRVRWRFWPHRVEVVAVTDNGVYVRHDQFEPFFARWEQVLKWRH